MIIKSYGRAAHSSKQGELIDVRIGRRNRFIAFLNNEKPNIETYKAGDDIKRGQIVIIDVNDTKVYSYIRKN